MRVLFLSSDITSVGGIQKYSRQSLDALRAANHEVTVIDKTRKQSKLWFGFRVLAFLWSKRPNLVVCGHINLAPVALLGSYITRTPYVVVTYGIESWDLKRVWHRASLRRAEVVATISRFTRNKLLDQLPELASRIYLLVNPVDGEEFYPKPRSADLCARHGLSSSDRILLTVSRLSASEQYKGYDTVIESMPRILTAVPNAKYLIVGKGNDRTRIERMVAERDLGHAVILCGYVPTEELIDYYNLCDVFVMPSTGEGFGIVFLEALACGKPVIVGNQDASQEAVLDGKLGSLVDPRDTRAIGDAVIGVLRHTPNSDRLDPEYLRHEALGTFGIPQFRASVSELLNRAAHHTLRVAYLGCYDPLYTRVRTTLKGLRTTSVTVYECRSTAHSRAVRLIVLAWKYLFIAPRIHAIIVSEAGQSYVFLAKLLSRITRKPLIFDAFMSYYHVNIVNAKLHTPTSIAAQYYFHLDAWSCRLADMVLLDTPEHCAYFHTTFGVPPEKMRSLPVGSDDEWFAPTRAPQDGTPFTVVLIASFYPIHGVEYVVEAARLLAGTDPDIRFVVIGNGFARAAAEERARGIRNIVFMDSVLSYDLPAHMSAASVCLGQFGDTEQNHLVVPAKVYDAIAMRKPVITGAGRAIRSVFTDGENIVLVPLANPRALADAIIRMKNDAALRESIAENGYQLFREKFSLSRTGEHLTALVRTVAAAHTQKP